MNELNILGLEATGGIQIENDEDDYSTTDIEENPSNTSTFVKKLNSNPENQQSKPLSNETDANIIKQDFSTQKTVETKSKQTQHKNEGNNTSRYSSKSKLIEKLLESLNTADNLLISTAKKHNPEEPVKEKEESDKTTPKIDTKTKKKKEKTELSKNKKIEKAPKESTTDSSFNAPDIPSPESDNEQNSRFLSESSDEDSAQSIPEVEEPKPIKKVKKTSLLQPKKNIKEPKQKNLEIYSTEGKEVGREIEIYRMITSIQEFFDNKYSIPQILATIHNNAGNVTKAIDCLKKGEDIGSENDLVRTDTVKGPQNLIQSYFHV